MATFQFSLLLEIDLAGPPNAHAPLLPEPFCHALALLTEGLPPTSTPLWLPTLCFYQKLFQQILSGPSWGGGGGQAPAKWRAIMLGNLARKVSHQ